MGKYDYMSSRARKARAGKVLNNLYVRVLLLMIVLLSLAGWMYLVFMVKSPFGWLLFSVSIAFLMILPWSKSELEHIPLGKGHDINDVLSANVFTVLGNNPTPLKFVQNIGKTRSGRFLAIRFGLTRQVLEMVASEIPEDMTPVFKRAMEIRELINAEVVSGGIILSAIIEMHPMSDKILHWLKLEKEDLYNGVDWYNHLYGLVRGTKKHIRDGGIARDLSFGYTPMLTRFGVNISERKKNLARSKIRFMSRREIIDKMIDIFSKGGRQNVTLIGTAGVGKTTIVKAFAEELLDADIKIAKDLKYRQIVMLDANALISAAGGEGKLERLMTMIVNEAYLAKNIILCLDNAQLFFEEGAGSVDLSNFFTPIIEAGRLRMIMMMNEQKFLRIAANNPNLTNCLNQVMIPPTNREETIRIMQDNALEIEARFGVVLTYLALKEAYSLSERYIHDMDMPGRAINLLETATSYAEDGLVTDRSVRVAIEKTKGVKLNVSETSGEKETLLNLEELIHKRMIDQEEAVKTVSDALRRAAAGVRNQNRPIGTFLFLGPTGVGKTELAKALAQVYFKGEGNIVRLDMNEYVTENDVARLLADGKDYSDSLVAQVTKRPFSVVLLDEIEKAHPVVLTTLLQLLDEGILRDINNREVSFRDAIVIATSNAGAGRIREYVKNGEDLAQKKAELVEEIIHSGQFKPEFVNRFDEICVFKPLGVSELREIVKLIIGSVNKTLEPRKISVVLDDDGIDELVKRGYDPMMGARPMKRIVQKTVENIIAKKILGDEIGDGMVVKITKDMLF